MISEFRVECSAVVARYRRSREEDSSDGVPQLKDGVSIAVEKVKNLLQRAVDSLQDAFAVLREIRQALPSDRSDPGVVRELIRCVDGECERLRGIQRVAAQTIIPRASIDQKRRLSRAEAPLPEKRVKIDESDSPLYVLQTLDRVYDQSKMIDRLEGPRELPRLTDLAVPIDAIEEAFAEAEKGLSREISEESIAKRALALMRQDKEEVLRLVGVLRETLETAPCLGDVAFWRSWNYPESFWNLVLAVRLMTGKGVDDLVGRKRKEALLGVGNVKETALVSEGPRLQEMFALSKSLPKDTFDVLMRLVLADVYVMCASGADEIRKLAEKLIEMGQGRLAELLLSFHEQVGLSEGTLLRELWGKMEELSDRTQMCREETKAAFLEGMSSKTLDTLEATFYCFNGKSSGRTMKCLFKRILEAFGSLKKMGFNRETSDKIIRRIATCVRRENPLFGWERAFNAFLSLSPELIEVFLREPSTIDDPTFLLRMQTKLFMP